MAKIHNDPIRTHTTQYGQLSYRFDKRSEKYLLVFHGTFTDIEMRDAEGYFIKRGYSVLSVARPGYRQTDYRLARQEGSFEMATQQLLNYLRIGKITVLGVSVGGRSAMRFASKFPGMVDVLILFSSASFSNWQNRIGGLASKLAFGSLLGGLTWLLLKGCMRLSPRRGVALLFSSMTTLKAKDVISSYPEKNFNNLRYMLLGCSSPKGVRIDISRINEKGSPSLIESPTLIIHSKYDAAVPIQHPQVLNSEIKNSKLLINETESHLMWFSPAWSAVESQIDEEIKSL